MPTFISVFSILAVFCVDDTTVLKFQLNVDHTIFVDIVLLIVFQLVQSDFQATFLFNVLTFLFFCQKRVLKVFYFCDEHWWHLWLWCMSDWPDVMGVGVKTEQGECSMRTQYVYTMCTLAKWHAILWLFCARCVRKTNSYVIAMMFVLLSICPSVCLPGTGVHCDHTVHFSADFTLRLGGPMFRALWHRAFPPYS